MFDIGWGELVVIGIVALIAIGPKELPGVLRSLGQWTAKIKRMAGEFQGQFQEAMREAEFADLKKGADDLKSAVSDIGSSFNPLTDTQKDIERAFEDADKPAASASSEPVSTTPLPDAATPLPEEPAPLSEKDFTGPAPEPEKKAGSGG